MYREIATTFSGSALPKTISSTTACMYLINNFVLMETDNSK
jgi:hypothetical protein